MNNGGRDGVKSTLGIAEDHTALAYVICTSHVRVMHKPNCMQRLDGDALILLNLRRGRHEELAHISYLVFAVHGLFVSGVLPLQDARGE